MDVAYVMQLVKLGHLNRPASTEVDIELVEALLPDWLRRRERGVREIFGIPVFVDATMPAGSWKLVGGCPRPGQPEPADGS